VSAAWQSLFVTEQCHSERETGTRAPEFTERAPLFTPSDEA